MVGRTLRAVQAVPVDNVPYEKKKFDYRVDSTVCRSNALSTPDAEERFGRNGRLYVIVASRVWFYIVDFSVPVPQKSLVGMYTAQRREAHSFYQK